MHCGLEATSRWGESFCVCSSAESHVRRPLSRPSCGSTTQMHRKGCFMPVLCITPLILSRFLVGLPWTLFRIIQRLNSPTRAVRYVKSCQTSYGLRYKRCGTDLWAMMVGFVGIPIAPCTALSTLYGVARTRSRRIPSVTRCLSSYLSNYMFLPQRMSVGFAVETVAASNGPLRELISPSILPLCTGFGDAMVSGREDLDCCCQWGLPYYIWGV